MKLTKGMEMMEMFDLIVKKDLSPNQFYLLYCMNENVASLTINMHQELRILLSDKWISQDNSSYKLEAKSYTLLEQVNSYFSIQKKKTSNQLMGKSYEQNIEQYLLLFPKIKLPSGKAARTDKKNCETAFKWFFENHDYNWETIIKATAMYVDEYERKNYMYMQTSQYFIRKQQSDKTWGSELANWCASADSGEMNSDDHFSEKVV